MQALVTVRCTGEYRLVVEHVFVVSDKTAFRTFGNEGFF
jgi:hypothetical protein